MPEVNLYTALSRMNELSNNSIPFSIEYYSCNISEGTSKGLLTYNNVVLRTGLSTNKGIKSRSLIGFTDLDTNTSKWFYLPLLMKFNKHTIKHARR